MGAEFDKKLMLDNITFLLKEFGKKIGELEAQAGVSTGYLSRTSKDENAKPGIDFIMKAADALNTSVDTLLKVDIGSLTPTEKYLISFFEKLIEDTNNDKLDWERESAGYLNTLEADEVGYVAHPLFSFETYTEPDECDYPQTVARVVFVSNSFDCHTYVKGDCFNLRLKNGAILYLMDISRSVHPVNDRGAFVKEVWMYVPHTGKQFISSTKDNSELASLVEKLYSAVCENIKHPKVKQEFRYIIDAYMENDINDDADYLEMPFL